ncbi:hypothetical protein [Nocardia sp. XZ_19_385]|uniref:hypothetical protein n=1 Tax=Nocardia sp. XZ_19_385 TaxID=2769488 RepID=UPI002815D9B7|nr:hypothetical protein [Nocardia sp. XZ_19_385]
MADTPPPAERQTGARTSLTDLSQWAQLVAQFVAPATALAGLLYYWGFFHAKGFCAYFGVDSTSLGLTTTDYVMRSADGLFIPLATFAVVALAIMWGPALLPRRLRERPRPRWLTIAVTVLGTLLLLNGLSQLQFQTPFNRGIGVAPFCLIIGLLMLWGVVRARRADLATVAGARPPTPAPFEWILIFLLVGGSFFWGATAYSLEVGKGRAVRIEQSLSSIPTLTLYTEKAIDLNIPGVRKVACTDPGSAYRYRYDGLVLVMSTNDTYLILPRTWSYRRGTAIVLPRNGVGALRPEFSRSPAATASQCG